MATPPRPSTQHLSVVADAAETTPRWGLFALLRRFEALTQSFPRIGRSRLPSQNVVDLAQIPSLGFSERTIDKIEPYRGRARIAGYWLGLLGPMGPMPTHITEYAYYEARYTTARPFGRFLDLLSGRMLQFFYRAWADSQPAAIVDRHGDDRFAYYLTCLTGAAEQVEDRSAFPMVARLHYAGLLASQRSAVGIQDGLSDLLGQPIKLLEYQPRWQTLEFEDCSRLGQQYCSLGRDVMLGSRVRTIADAFRVVIRAASLRDYESLLPTGKRFTIAAEALEAFAPSNLEWDMQVEIAQKDAPSAGLDGRARLGWTSWLGKRQDSEIRRDAHLRRPVKRAQEMIGGYAS